MFLTPDPPRTATYTRGTPPTAKPTPHYSGSQPDDSLIARTRTTPYYSWLSSSPVTTHSLKCHTQEVDMRLESSSLFSFKNTRSAESSERVFAYQLINSIADISYLAETDWTRREPWTKSPWWPRGRGVYPAVTCGLWTQSWSRCRDCWTSCSCPLSSCHPRTRRPLNWNWSGMELPESWHW